jgi:RNA polymerase sigma-70 factor (ECF subfamily)
MGPRERQHALEQARLGDREALGQLLLSFRAYVRAVVHGMWDERLRPRVDASDLIQDVYLEAQRSFAGFQGTSVAELVVWLRQIVVRSAGHCLRANLGTGKRDPGREQAGADVNALAADSDGSPSGQAIGREQATRLAEALERLPDDMRQVLLGRHLDEVPYAVLAERLNRSEGAVRVLYTRALRRLREECAE